MGRAPSCEWGVRADTVDVLSEQQFVYIGF